MSQLVSCIFFCLASSNTCCSVYASELSSRNFAYSSSDMMCAHMTGIFRASSCKSVSALAAQKTEGSALRNASTRPRSLLVFLVFLLLLFSIRLRALFLLLGVSTGLFDMEIDVSRILSITFRAYTQYPHKCLLGVAGFRLLQGGFGFAAGHHGQVAVMQGCLPPRKTHCLRGFNGFIEVSLVRPELCRGLAGRLPVGSTLGLGLVF